MRKYLKLINRGLILFLVLIMGVAIYLAVQNQEARKIRPELEKTAEEFVAEAAKLVVMPESLRLLPYEGFYESDALNQHIGDQSDKLSIYYSDNEAIREYSSMWLSMSFSTQYSESVFILSSQPKIVKFDNFSVYKGKATLTFSIEDTMTLLMPDGEEQTEGMYGRLETITFIKEGNRWVINSYESSRLSSDLWQNNW